MNVFYMQSRFYSNGLKASPRTLEGEWVSSKAENNVQFLSPLGQDFYDTLHLKCTRAFDQQELTVHGSYNSNNKICNTKHVVNMIKNGSDDVSNQPYLLFLFRKGQCCSSILNTDKPITPSSQGRQHKVFTCFQLHVISAGKNTITLLPNRLFLLANNQALSCQKLGHSSNSYYIILSNNWKPLRNMIAPKQ